MTLESELRSITSATTFQPIEQAVSNTNQGQKYKKLQNSLVQKTISDLTNYVFA